MNKDDYIWPVNNEEKRQAACTVDVEVLGLVVEGLLASEADGLELLPLQAAHELLELHGHGPHVDVVVSELTQNDNDQTQT